MDAADWLKRHARAERALAADLERFFLRQARRVLVALADYDDPTPAIAADVLDAAAENDLLLTVAVSHLVRGMAAGTMQQLARRPGRRRKKEFDEAAINRELAEFDLPDYAVKAIENALAELSGQSYWKDIQKTTQTNIADVIREGIDSGDSGSKMARTLRELLGKGAKVRAKAIARTETTLAFNAGHQAAFDTMAEDGNIDGKTWLAIDDPDVRDSHRELNEKTVGPRENFSVGGHDAPYPGHWNLPADERVNCRCTVIGSFDDK